MFEEVSYMKKEVHSYISSKVGRDIGRCIIYSRSEVPCPNNFLLSVVMIPSFQGGN